MIGKLRTQNTEKLDPLIKRAYEIIESGTYLAPVDAEQLNQRRESLSEQIKNGKYENGVDRIHVKIETDVEIPVAYKQILLDAKRQGVIQATPEEFISKYIKENFAGTVEASSLLNWLELEFAIDQEFWSRVIVRRILNETKKYKTSTEKQTYAKEKLEEINRLAVSKRSRGKFLDWMYGHQK